jgi:aryl-alcohol dehydrogenase-like predicted oxidoreductase
MDGKTEWTVPLGSSEVRVSPLGVGTNRWGAGGAARPELEPVFRAALDAGVGFFDSAEIYGRGGSERSLGRFLPSAPVRPVVLSKFFPMPWRLSRKALLSALEASLERLGLPAVDVYLVHFPTPPVPVETWADALADAVGARLARAVGVSNYSAPQMRRAHAVLAARGVPLACNEVEYSLLRRDPERNGVLSACRELGVSLVAYRPLALGTLPGESAGKEGAQSQRGVRRVLFARGYEQRAGGLPGVLSRIGEARGRTPAQVALNWVMRKGAIPVPGATSRAHLLENAGALGWSLTAEEVAELDGSGGQARRGGPR